MDASLRILLLAFLVAVPGLGLVAADWVLNFSLLTLAYGLAALMLMLLWRGGLVSFGHALYFGLGAYSTVLVNQELGVQDVVVVTVGGALAAGSIGFCLGFIMRRYRGIFFAMLNLAFSMVLYGLIVKSEALGSTDGFSVLAPTFLGYEPPSPEAAKRMLYVLVGTVTFGVAAGLHVYLRTGLGRLMEAIRDNEIRIEYLGYSPNRVVHINYTISAAFTGVAGVFLALAVGQVDPDSMVNWTTSGELVFITVLGGINSVGAPLLGALIFETLRTYAFEFFPAAWRMMVGVALLGLILFAPEGMWSLIARIRAWRRPVPEKAL